MPALNADNAPLNMPCGKCGHVSKATFGQLKKSGGFTCSSCGQRTNVDGTDLVRTLDELNKAIGKNR